MGYGKSKPGMFKMKHQGVPALMKALVGDQHKLPNHLKEAIKAAPEKSPAKKYGDKVLKKDDPTERAKSSAKLKRNERGTIVGTSTEKGGDTPVGTKRGTQKMAARTGESFDKEGNVKMGKNKKMQDNLMTLADGTVYAYKDTSGKQINIPHKDRFNVKVYKRTHGSHGEGLTNRTARKIKSDYFDYNSKIDAINRSSDRASKIVAAEKGGANVRYNERKDKRNPKTAGAAPKKVKGMGPVRKEDQTSKYGKKHDRLRKQAKKLDDKSMDPKKPVSDKKFNKLQDRRDKKINKARKIRKKANS